MTMYEMVKDLKERIEGLERQRIEDRLALLKLQGRVLATENRQEWDHLKIRSLETEVEMLQKPGKPQDVVVDPPPKTQGWRY